MKPVFWLFATAALAAAPHVAPQTGKAPHERAPAISDRDADKIIRDSCQRCHDNARVRFVRDNPNALPAIKQSARFNLETKNLLDDADARARVLRAIETGGMPFAEMFIVSGESIHRDTFLASDQGRALLAWLRR